jgi:phosphoribosylglycinamide formyltransferase 2
MITQQQNEFELHARAILGLPVDTGLLRIGASAVILSHTEADDVVYEGLDAALSIPGSEIRLFGKPRALFNRRMGVALASAATVEEATKKAVKAASLVIVNAK